MTKKSVTLRQQKRAAQGRRAKSLLVAAGVPLKEIARKAGTVPAVVSDVISGRRPSPRVRRVISEALKMPIDQLWPDNNHNQKAA